MIKSRTLLVIALLSCLLLSSALATMSTSYSAVGPDHHKKKNLHNGDGYQIIGVGNKPVGVAANASGYIYVATFNNMLYIINPTTNTVVKTMNLTTTSCSSASTCQSSFMAFDPQNNAMYIAQLNTVDHPHFEAFLYVLNASNNKFVTLIGLGASEYEVALGVAYDPANQEIYVPVQGNCTASQSSTVAEIDTNTNTVVHSTTVGNCNDFGGAVAYDYANQEVYAANSYSSRFGNFGNISAISSITNQVMNTLPSDGNVTIGLAYDPVSQEMYATSVQEYSSGYYGYVLEFDSTNVLVNYLGTDGYGVNAPAAITYDPADGDMYVANLTQGANPGPVVILAGTTGNFIASANAFGAVFSLAYSPANGGEIFAANEVQSSVTELGGTSFIPSNFAAVGSPRMIGYDQKNKFVYVTNGGNSVFGFPTASGSQVTYNGFNGADAIAYDPVIQTLLVGNNGNGTVSALNATSGAYLGTFPTGSGPFQVVYDPSLNEFLVPNYNSGNVSVFSYSSGVWTHQTLNQEFGLTVSFDNPTSVAVYANATEQLSNIYVSNAGNATVTVINTLTDKVSDISSFIGSGPGYLAAANNHVYVPSRGSNMVSIINVISNTVVKLVSGFSIPEMATYDPQDGEVFVTNFNSATVTTINGGGNIVAQISVPVSFALVYASSTGEMYISCYSANVITGINS